MHRLTSHARGRPASPLAVSNGATRPVRQLAHHRSRSALLLLLADLWLPVLVAALDADRASILLAVAAGLALAHHSAGLYRRRFVEDVLDDLPQMILGVLVGLGLGALVVIVTHEPLTSYPVLLGPGLLVSSLVGRQTVYWHRRRRRRASDGSQRLLIVGDGDGGLSLARALLYHCGPDIVPVGIVGSAGSDMHDASPLPVLGGHDDLLEVITSQEVTMAILSSTSLTEWRLTDTVSRLGPRAVDLYTVPVGYSLWRHPSGVTDSIAGIPIIALNLGGVCGHTARVKRAVDVVVSALALVLLSPLLLAIAIAVRMETGPGVIFRQERIGRGGHPFTLYKFTSLIPADDEEAATRWTVAGDHDAVGPVGRFIRATSLDELPQLVNILRGEMSLVGPRPERPYFVEQYRAVYPTYDSRHRAPAGLTGHAAVNGLRGDTSIEERARFDNRYIDTWSLWGDAKILLRTVGCVVRRRGG